MAEHTPVRKPGADDPITASATILGGQLVAISGNNTVAPASASGDWYGVAAFDAATGKTVTVHRGGIHELAASGAIVAGARVIPAAAGAVVTIGASTDYSKIVGIARSAAAGGKVVVAF